MLLSSGVPSPMSQCPKCFGRKFKLDLGGVKIKCSCRFEKPADDPHPIGKIDKRSKAYKETHKKLTDLGLSSEEAAEQIEDAVKEGTDDRRNTKAKKKA